MEADLLHYAAGGGVLFGAALLLRGLLIAFLACMATLSKKSARRTSAFKVLELLWVRHGRRSGSKNLGRSTDEL